MCVFLGETPTIRDLNGRVAYKVMVRFGDGYPGPTWDSLSHDANWSGGIHCAPRFNLSAQAEVGIYAYRTREQAETHLVLWPYHPFGEKRVVRVRLFGPTACYKYGYRAPVAVIHEDEPI